MSFFNRLFQKEKPKEIPTMPPWEEIVEMMYDKCLGVFTAEVVRVVYSIDKTMRYVVLRYEQGLYTYQLEAICKLDEDEWRYALSHNDDALPALWESLGCAVGESLFDNEEELLKEMKEEPEYKKYFE